MAKVERFETFEELKQSAKPAADNAVNVKAMAQLEEFIDLLKANRSKKASKLKLPENGR